MNMARSPHFKRILISAFILNLACGAGLGVSAEIPANSLPAKEPAMEAPLSTTPPSSEAARRPQPSIDAPDERSSASHPDVTHVVINVPSRTLWVYSGTQIIRYFPVGVGRVGFMTPLGNFKIIRKVEDPGWENPYLPNGKVRLAPGETNPLGTRWMGFYQKGGGEYGMHGTDNPGSVGKFSSHGCVRMKIPDAEALFNLVDVGTPVQVVYQPVLIRSHHTAIRLIVYPDRFKRGMPSAEKIQAEILAQYPGAKVDFTRIQAALQTPNERPIDVGTRLLSTTEQQPMPTASENTGDTANP